MSSSTSAQDCNGLMQPAATKTKTLFGFVCVVLTGIGYMLWASSTNTSEFLMAASIIWTTITASTILMVLKWDLFDIFQLKICGIYAFSFIILILIPAPFIYNDVANDSARDNFIVAISLGFLSSLLAISTFRSSSNNHSLRYSYKKITQIDNIGIMKLACLALLVISIAIMFTYIEQVGTLPIAQAITGDTTRLELALAREDALKLIDGPIRYLFRSLRNIVFPYTTILALLIALESKNRFWYLVGLISLGGTLVMASATLEKAVVGASLLPIVFAWLIIRKQRLTFVPLVLITILGISFPVFTVFAVYQFEIDSTTVFTALFNRIFYTPSFVLFHYFDLISSEQSLLWGRTLPYISNLLPGGNFPITNIISLKINPFSVVRTGSANAAYIGYLWADFGWLGVTIGGLLCGSMLRVLNNLIESFQNSIPIIILHAMLAYRVVLLTASSISDVFDPLGNGFSIVLSLLLLFLATNVSVESPVNTLAAN